MKKYLLPVIATALAVNCSTAIAGPVTHTVTLNASVAAVCNINGAPTSHTGTFENITANTSKFTATVTNGIAQQSTGTLRFPDIACNGSSIRVSLDPGGKPITTGNGDAANKKIHYKAEVINQTSNQVVVVDTKQSVNATAYGDAIQASGPIDLKITITSGETTLLAGQYTGTLKINFDTI